MSTNKTAQYKTICSCAISVLLIAVLVVAIVYFNVLYKEPTIEGEGFAIGEKCPDFELEGYVTAGNPSGANFKASDALGQVLVINFWYVNCGGCKAELPHFNEVQQEYGDQVKIIVVHAHNVDTSANKQAKINEFGYGDYLLTFVQDNAELWLYKQLGGDGNFPMTAVLDKDGYVRSVTIGAMSKETLSAEIEKYL